MPNGFEADGTTPKFDEVVIENDIHAGGPIGSFTDKWILCYINNGFRWEILSHCFSGSTLPTQTGENRLGYNTTLNKIQVSINGGAYIDDICSFPICIFSTNSGVITSIDQAFNGFGYIGSTVFALPGVKGLIPNGRNADGSLKNIEKTLDKVILYDYGPEGYTGSVEYIIRNDSTISNSGVGFHVSYDGYLIDDYNGAIKYSFVFARGYRTSGKITSFTPKTTFHAVDYNDRGTVVGWGMPDYSAVVTCASPFTAPSNGFISYNNTGTENCTVNGNTVYVGGNDSNNEGNVTLYLSKNDIIVFYNDHGTPCFVPCKGVN